MISFVRKTFAIVEVLRTVLQPVYEQVDATFVYGSIAKGEDSASSDIDLLVISESLAYAYLMTVLADAGELFCGYCQGILGVDRIFLTIFS